MSFILPFTKMHGLGNDFIVVAETGSRLFPTGPHTSPIQITPDLARKLLDRHFGVGADQILWLREPRGPGDIRMEIFNPDGSAAEMCGNGIRAVALYLRDHGVRRTERYEVETLAGLLTVSLKGDLVTVNMGQPMLGRGARSKQGEILELSVGSGLGPFFEIGMGNPHAVFFLASEDVGSLDEFPLEAVGPSVECHPRFPKRTNVEFVQVMPAGSTGSVIRVRVWERGAGITLACGTGACASAVAALVTGRAQSPVQVDLPGGRLKISWEGEGHPIMMEGPAREVFSGRYSIED